MYVKMIGAEAQKVAALMDELEDMQQGQGGSPPHQLTSSMTSLRVPPAAYTKQHLVASAVHQQQSRRQQPAQPRPLPGEYGYNGLNGCVDPMGSDPLLSLGLPPAMALALAMALTRAQTYGMPVHSNTACVRAGGGQREEESRC